MSQESDSEGRFSGIQNWGSIDSSYKQNCNNISNTDNSVNNSVDNSVINHIYNSGVGTTILGNQILYQAPLQERSETEWRQVATWLSTLTPNKKQNEILSKRDPGTGEWFLKHHLFLEWLSGEHCVLLCTGIPASGKTVLASIIIHHLEMTFESDQATGVAYVYCNHEEDQQTAGNLIASLISQLAARNETSYSLLSALYQKYKKTGARPLLPEFSEILWAVLRTFKRVFIVIDALDELVSFERDKVIAEIKKLSEADSKFESMSVSVLILSRSILDPEYFKDDAQLDIVTPDEVLELYISEYMSTRFKLVRLAKRSPEFAEGIAKIIIEKARGMFPLVRLLLEAVATGNCTKEIQTALQGPHLPEALDTKYNHVLRRIETQVASCVDLATAALMWILYASRPLAISELQHALAIKNDTELDEDTLISEENIISACAGFIILNHGSGTFEFAHHTVAQYLKHSDRGSQFLPAPHAKITGICLKYLSLKPLWSHNQEDGLLDYALQNWGYHAHKGLLENPDLKDKILNFLEQPISFGQWEKLMEVLVAENPLKWRCTCSDLDLLPVIVAVGFELREIILTLMLKKGPGLVIEAASRGHESVVGVLLQYGAKIESINRDGNTLLSIAAHNGHYGVAQLLLEKGAEIDSQNRYGATPLYRAVDSGHEPMVGLLLENGADVRLTTRWGNRPLHRAADSGHQSVVQLLLERGAYIEPQNQLGKTPLHLATAAGHEHVVRLLLEKGASVDLRNVVDDSEAPNARPLLNQEDMVKKIIKDGRQAELQTILDNTPFQVAFSLGQEHMMQLVWTSNPFMRVTYRRLSSTTALHMAAYYGHKHVVQLLLEKGVNTDLRDTLDNTPLHVAVYYGHKHVVQLLLEKGVNTDLRDTFGNTPLHEAAKAGHEGIVQLLLAAGANFEMQNRWNETPLALATNSTHERVVQLLLTAKAEAMTSRHFAKQITAICRIS